MSIKYEEHDPDAVLDYPFNWIDWLSDGETITNHSISIAPSGGTMAQSRPSEVQGAVVVAWLTGGVDGERYRVTCHIVTSDGREDDRSKMLHVHEL